ncbi:Gfo/Idh/MocA family oxidoreductase [soil metagenome]
MTDAPVTLAIVGAGSRGSAYARCAAASGARVVSVAEPRRLQREQLASEHGLPPHTTFRDWRELAAGPRLSDAVLIATQDALHVEPAVRFADLGYHLLLEKPMATTEADCVRIVDAVEAAGVLGAVCHVLRYTPYTREMKRLVDSGDIGEVVSVEHLEPVGWWHHAHSYVRGNWRREDESTFMLMAKSCHDLDWLAHLTGRRASRVSSFGGLYHFRPEQRPAGAADRCLDCAVEPDCPYSASRLYLGCLGDPAPERWPLSVVTDELTEAGVRRALREGPYGRCVYACDNDVVDHQVVGVEYEGGVTASFTMTAFTPLGHRRTRVFGTRGSLEGDGVDIVVHDFVTGGREVVHTATGTHASAAAGHGGGDQGLVDAFLAALRTGDGAHVLSDVRGSLHTHRVVWAAERARHSGAVVDVARE